MEAILAGLAIIPYTEQTAYEHARIRGKLEPSGKMFRFYDVIVAATTREQAAAWLTLIRGLFPK
ncbi:MAG TPA: hypothetical protein VKV05_03210 [Terriglobales bacterium]|nr:hypothetical protein [Terriglobales bacterium]